MLELSKAKDTYEELCNANDSNFKRKKDIKRKIIETFKCCRDKKNGHPLN